MMKKWRSLNPPVRWLLYFIAASLLLSFLFAPRPQPVNYANLSFDTLSSSKLYFRNVRSYYYHIYQREKAPFILYRLKRRSTDSLQPRLQFMIVENASADEAYIFAEPNRASQHMAGLQIKVAGHSYVLATLNNEGHLQLAAAVYNALLEDEQIWLVSLNDTVIAAFPDQQSRKNATIVLEDFFKLTNKS